MADPRQTLSISLTDDGIFPNNSRVPLTVYPGVFGNAPVPEKIEVLLQAKGWPPAWRYGVFAYHHYHSTAHEFLGCFKGKATILFGGDRGQSLEIRPGDGVMIPAGVAHKCLTSNGFTVVGAYPAGQSPDMNTGQPEERTDADRHIRVLGLPPTDPVTGAPWA